MENYTCGTCYYYKEGKCKCYAPSPESRINSPTVWPIWPSIDKDETACGEHESI